MIVHRIVRAAMIIALAGRIASAEEAALPMSLMTDGARTAECDEEITADSVLDSSDLSGGQSLVQVRCWRAAYQSGTVFFAMPADAPDKARLLRFPLPPEPRAKARPKAESKQGVTSAFSLSDAEFDPATKTMRSHYKSRGVGDCGTIGEWKWSGSDFKLVRYWSKPKCDGNLFEDNRRWQVFPPRR